MTGILRPLRFAVWLRRFMPGIEEGLAANFISAPAGVGSHRSTRLCVLDGLNLSRALVHEGN